MTRRRNSTVAGITFLVYIAAGISSMILFNRASRGEGTAARLARVAEHSPEMSVVVLLALLTSVCAVVLGVTLYAITRDQDSDIAMLGLAFRLLEGVAHLSIAGTLGLTWIAALGPAGPGDGAARELLGGFLFRVGSWGPDAFLFAVGSTMFAWLFLRGRIIPVPLAWLGLVASVLLIVVLPLQLSGLAAGLGAAGWLVWLPMLVFELVLAFWLILKGAAVPRARNES